MKILGVDTTTNTLCLAIYDNSKVYEYNLELGKKLSALLMVTIRQAIEALGWKISQVDYFACGVGPGSFTGLRVGMSTIKGLAFSLNKPIVAIPTLDILAQNAAGFDADYIMPAIDAKRGLIYCSIYRPSNKKLKRVSPYMLLSEKEFINKAKNKSIILGDALNLYQESFTKNLKNPLFLDKDYWKLAPRYLIELGLQSIKERKISDCFGIKPIYLYAKECQIKK